MIPIRVLFCDDSLDERHIRRELKEFGPSVEPVICRTIDAGIEAIKRNYFDMAFVDYQFPNEKKGDRDGFDVLDLIEDLSPSCRRILMTKFLKERGKEVFKHASLPNEADRLLVVNKSDRSGPWFSGHIEATFAARLKQVWELPDIDDAVSHIIKNRRKKLTSKMRHEYPEAIKDEVRRILFQIFDEAVSTKFNGVQPTLVLEDTLYGRSGSAALQVRLNYGDDERGRPILGARCFVKVGYRTATLNEAERYRRYVSMGVPSEFRVDLLGTALADSLGGVCYSAAGGSFSSETMPLDEIVREGNIARASSVIARLFDPTEDVPSRTWTAIAGEEQLISDFYLDKFETELDIQIEDVHKFLRGTKVGAFDEGKSRWTLGARTVSIPKVSDVGENSWGVATPTCLVHGDMHGGNLLVNDADKPFMIDFATVGIGPRFADSAALATTVRLESIEAGDTLGDDATLAKLIDGEERLLHEERTEGDFRKFADDGWFALSDKVNASSLVNAKVSNAEGIPELAQTQLAYALSRFSLPWHSRAHKLRLAIWIGVLHTYMTEHAL